MLPELTWSSLVAVAVIVIVVWVIIRLARR